MPSPEETSLPVEYLTTTRLGEKGQITLPKAYRDTIALEVGAPITVLQLGSGLLLIPEDTRFRALCDRIATTFARHGVEAEALLATLPDTRARVVTQHYPQLVERERARPRRPRP
jgi:bifunctional DNA-binding transcriptional regulator/antitoxin component of YhaV-PrlF toxin-antitoxin module